jgi:pimeloyl-ACP methyl ester carboxylesterase
MKKLFLFLFAMISMLHAQNQAFPPGDLFSDDFSPNSTANWTDMQAWGFGVWQVENNQFTSRDPNNKGICTAIPVFKKGIVNRDYCARFRFKPVSGSNYLFSIQVRQDGWSHYKIEIGADGTVKIIKAGLGKWPQILAETPAGKITFSAWHWLRLDVAGENPVILRVKIWSGEPADEPVLFTAAATDDQPLQPGNLNFALTMLQEGGAHTVLENFNIYRQIPVFSGWQWHSCPAAKSWFEQRKFAQSISLVNAENCSQISRFNNLALIAAERGQLDSALNFFNQALANAAADPILQQNLKWFSILRGGLVQANPVPLNLALDRQVYSDESPANLKLTVFPFESHPASAQAEIQLRDVTGKILRTEVTRLALKPGQIYSEAIPVSLADLADGKYQVLVKLTDSGNSATAELEIIRDAFQTQWQHFRQLEALVTAQKEKATHPNDWANVAVGLKSIAKMFRDCDAPGNFALYSGKITSDLAQLQTQADSLQKGSNPFAHATGQFLRGYFSGIDGSLQAYAIRVPVNFTFDKPIPIVINLHGYDPSFSAWEDNPFLQGFNAAAGERYLLVNPFGRGNTMYQNIGEADVLEVLAEVRRLYSVDENRIYLTGGSMGGAGTWHIGLSYPDLFAAIAPIMGPTELLFWTGLKPEQLSPVQQFIFERNSALFKAENARNLPVFCNHGVRDDIVPIEQSRKIVQRLRDLGYPIHYQEHPAAAHGSFPPEMDSAIYDGFEPLNREPNPFRVTLRTGHLKHNQAYWVTLDGIENQIQFAEIDAEIISKNQLQIRTQNVVRFSLNLPPELIEPKTDIKFKIDDSKSIKIRGTGGQLTFVKETNWQIASAVPVNRLQKTPHLAGPISEAFNSGFLLVYGTDTDTQINRREAERFSQQWETGQHVPCRILPDTAVTGDEIRRFHLILVGGPQANRLTQKINADLPIRFAGGTIVAGTQQFSGDDVGLAQIYPNPLNPEKYVVILAGITGAGTDGVVKRIGTEFDYLIFDGKTVGLNFLQGNLAIEGTPLRCGFFDSDWQLTEKFQVAANPILRGKILPRRLPQFTEIPAGVTTFELSNLKPIRIEQVHGWPECDRDCWGQAFSTDSTGVGVFPNSVLIYHLADNWNNFKATLAPTLNPYFSSKKTDEPGGRFQFGVFGDGDELFVSEVMTANSAPQPIQVDIRGVRELKLVVRSQNWLPNVTLGASWIGARLTR